KLKRVSRIWSAFSLVVLLSITVITGFHIYQSAVNFQGKLAFKIHDLRFKKEIEFVHDNLYEDGLNGLLEDIETKASLPKELYMSSEFDLTFDQNGQIMSLNSFLYGKNEDNETKSFLIDFDKFKSDKLTVHLDGYAAPDFDELKKVQPLIDGIDILPIKETVSEW